MDEALVLEAQKRQDTGTRATRRLRKAGKVPAIIYGHGLEAVAIELDGHDLAMELQHHHRLLDVVVDGARERYLVKDLQYDYLYEHVIHVDLVRVRLDERVKVTVAVELRGTPAGAAEGGVLEQLATDIELECVVTSIPENIRVSVKELQVGQTLTAGDLELPAGAQLASEAELAIAVVRTVEEEEAAEETAAGEGEAEPERIQREREEEAGS